MWKVIESKDMSNELLEEVKRVSRLACMASRLPIGQQFASLPSIKAFIRQMENECYIFAELSCPLNGYSVRNEADQIFQFCCSIETNEADTLAGR